MENSYSMKFSNIFSFRVRFYHFSLIEEVYDHLLLVLLRPITVMKSPSSIAQRRTSYSSQIRYIGAPALAF